MTCLAAAVPRTIPLPSPQLAENDCVPKKRNGKPIKRKVEPIYKEIGAVIAEFRLNRQMSIQQVADAIGMSRQQLSRVELGQSRLLIHDLLRIAGLLGVHPLEILRDFID